MAVPTAITDLSTTAGSNPPNGSSDTPQEGDDHIRAAYSFIAQNYANKATIASPTFTGTPAAPTAAVDTNTTQLATTAFVIGQGYAKLASPTFTGTVATATLTSTGITSTGALTAATFNAGAADNADTVLTLNRSAGTGVGAAVIFTKLGSNLGNISLGGSAVSYNTTSDYRLKNITGPVEHSGAFIDALQPKSGTWKADGSPFVGFVAHELQAVSPMSVTGEKDGEQMQSVAYGSAELIANMVAELKSLRARVAALEA